MLVLWLLLVLIGRWVVYYVSVLVGVWDFWGSIFVRCWLLVVVDGVPE